MAKWLHEWSGAQRALETAAAHTLPSPVTADMESESSIMMQAKFTGTKLKCLNKWSSLIKRQSFLNDIWRPGDSTD